MLLVVMICFLDTPLAIGQSDQTGQRRVTGTYVITNATVITQPGKWLTSTSIVIKDGLITDIGQNVTIPV